MGCITSPPCSNTMRAAHASSGLIPAAVTVTILSLVYKRFSKQTGPGYTWTYSQRVQHPCSGPCYKPHKYQPAGQAHLAASSMLTDMDTHDTQFLGGCLFAHCRLFCFELDVSTSAIEQQAPLPRCSKLKPLPTPFNPHTALRTWPLRWAA